jgi:chemotaxis protein MotB
MARKPKHEEHENHERWLVSYADFITLLFAFFVVMYAISSVNEGKYRVLSSALVSAFSHPQKTVEPIQYGTPLHSPIIQHDAMVESVVSRVGVDHQIMPSPKEMAEMQKIADEVEYNLKELIDKELITVTRTNLGLEIEIKSNILFTSGVAVLSSQAISPLKKIATILSKTPNDINVEGYTDNVPINTPYFPSNWELSAARAASVVRLFTQSGVNPNRLKAIGFAEHRAIADNVTEFGRSKNRRVAIMVLNKPDEKRVSLGLDKKQKNDSNTQDIDNKNLDDKSKPITIINLDQSGRDKNNNRNDSNNNSNNNARSPRLLSPQSVKPPITTLPLANTKSNTASRAAPNRQAVTPAAQDKSGTASESTVIVKPAESVSLPVLQVLPNGKGDSN